MRTEIKSLINSFLFTPLRLKLANWKIICSNWAWRLIDDYCYQLHAMDSTLDPVTHTWHKQREVCNKSKTKGIITKESLESVNLR